MQPPRPPMGPTKAPPRPAQATPRTPTEICPSRPLNEFENASELELRNKLNEHIRVSCWLKHLKQIKNIFYDFNAKLKFNHWFNQFY